MKNLSNTPLWFIVISLGLFLGGIAVNTLLHVTDDGFNRVYALLPAFAWLIFCVVVWMRK
jgi:hypothetical protein